MSKRGVLAVGAVFLLLALPAGALARSACDLITQDEASAALGRQVKPGELSGPNPLGQTVCFFDAVGDDAVRFVQVSLVALPDKMKQNGYTVNKLYDDSMAFLSAPQPVDGLGDKSHWGGTGLKMGAGLHVLSGENYLVIMVATGNEAVNLKESKALAEKILPRLN